MHRPANANVSERNKIGGLLRILRAGGFDIWRQNGRSWVGMETARRQMCGKRRGFRAGACWRPRLLERDMPWFHGWGGVQLLGRRLSKNRKFRRLLQTPMTSR